MLSVYIPSPRPPFNCCLALLRALCVFVLDIFLSLLSGAPRLQCAATTWCGSQLAAMASLRSLRLGGVGIILGLATLVVVRSSLTPATIEPDGDDIVTRSFAEGDVVVIPPFAQGDASEFPSWTSGVHPSWDGSVGDGFGAANMQVRASLCFACGTLALTRHACHQPYLS